MAGVTDHRVELGRARSWRSAARAALAAVDAYWLAYGAVVAAALVLRVVDLANRPLHADESAHAWFSWLFLTGRDYEYDPVFHGPVQFYIGALMEAVAGVGDTAIRLGPALFGTATVALPAFLRRQLGSAGALAASIALCISPSYLYYARFGREDAYAAFFTLALLVAVFRFLDHPRRWHPSLIFGLLAVAFAVKETTYITVAIAGSFFAAVAVLEVWRAGRAGRPAGGSPLLGAVRSVGRDAWIWAATTFAFVFTVLYTTFLVRPGGLRTGLYGSLDYWLSQQPVNRGSQPWFYYLVVLPLYELPTLGLALVGVVVALRRPTLFRLFLVWDAVASLVVYSWASERMPWLALHPLLPLILLAAVGFEALWRRRPAARVALAAGAAAGAAFLCWGALQVTYRHPADPAELLVFTQTSPQLDRARAELLPIARRSEGRGTPIVVDGWGGTGWPWGWYLRDVPVRYLDLETEFAALSDRPDAVIVAEVNDDRVRPLLRGYERRRFHLREWWVVDYGAISAGNLWRWFVDRRAWSERGYLDEYLYVRRRDATRGRPPPGLRGTSAAPEARTRRTAAG